MAAGSDPASFLERHAYWALAGICFAALAFRVAVVQACSECGLFSDMFDYHDRAQRLVRRGVLYRDVFRPPAYPSFLAVLYAWTDENLTIVRTAQAMLGAAVVAITFVLARSGLSAAGSLAAAAIVAVYPSLVLVPALLLSENLFIPLVLLGLCLGMRRGASAGVLAGVVLGAATLTRSVGLAAIAGVVVARWRGGSFPTAVLPVAAGCALVLAPWIVRNSLLYERPALFVDTAGGYNFLVGNNPMATGRLELRHLDRLEDTYWVNAGDDAERSDIGYREGLRFVVSNPLLTLWRSVRKLQFLAGLEGREQSWIYSEERLGARSAWTVWLWGAALLVSFPLVMLPALAGLLAPGFGRWPPATLMAVTLGAVAGLHVLTFGESRFHQPWIPLLAILAVRGWCGFRPAGWSLRRRVVVGALAAALVLTWMDQAANMAARLGALAGAPDEPPRLGY